MYSAEVFNQTHADTLVVAKAEAISPYDIERLPIRIRSVDKFLFGGFPRGTGYTVIAGSRGKGKSTVVNQIVAQALEMQKGVLMYSGEKSCGTARGYLEATLAGPFGMECVRIPEKKINGYTMDAHNEYRINAKYKKLICASYGDLFSFYNPSGSNFDHLLKTVSDFADCGGEVVIVDNVMMLESAISNSSIKASEDRRRLQSGLVALAQLAIDRNLWIFVVAHTKKEQAGYHPEDLSDLVRGESVVTDAASLVLFYQMPSGEPDSKDRVIKISKNRDFGDLNVEKGFRVAFDPSSRRIYDPNNTSEELGYKYLWQRSAETFPERYGLEVEDIIHNMSRSDDVVNAARASKDAELAQLKARAAEKRAKQRKAEAVKDAALNVRAEKLDVEF